MIRTFAILASAVLLLAGCTSLPTSGPPHDFAIDPPVREPLGQQGSGPRDGSTQEQLVSDFLRASAAGSFDDYATAKTYLLPAAADSWRPTAQVTVFPTDKIPVPKLEDDRGNYADVLLEVPTMATMDSSGVLHEYPGTESTPLSFRLAKNSDGQWRISALSDGLVLSQSSFTTGFGMFNLYFPSQDEQVLVADPRWVPRLRVSSHLTQALLAGPSEALAPAVAFDLVGSLSLPTGGVQVVDRVAHVELEGQLPADPQARMLLQWQLSHTLRQAPNVQVVLVAINGLELDPFDEPSSLDFDLERYVAFRDHQLVLGSLVAPFPVVEVSEDATAPAVGPLSQSPVGWLSPDQVNLLGPADAEPLEVPLPGAATMSIDRYGNAWVAGNGGVARVDRNGEVQDIAELGLNGSVSRIGLSADGARIALLVDGQLWLGTVVVDQDAAVHVGSLALQDRLGDQVLDFSWSGTTGMSVLVQNQEAQLAVQAPLGGFLTSYSAPADVVRIAGAQGTLGTVVQREDQVAFQRVGAAWREVAADLAYIATP